MVALPLRGALAFRAEPKPMGNLMARGRPRPPAPPSARRRGAPRGRAAVS